MLDVGLVEFVAAVWLAVVVLLRDDRGLLQELAVERQRDFHLIPIA